MTLDQAIAEVQQICGWRSDKATEITRALQYAQTEREKPNRTYPWFLRKQDDQAIITSYKQMTYSIPADYIEDTEEIDGNLFIYLLSSPGPDVTATSLIMREADPTAAYLHESALPPYTRELSPSQTSVPPNPVGSPMSRTVFLKKQQFQFAQVRYFGEWPYVYYNPAGAIFDTGAEIGPGVPRDYYLGDTFVQLYPPPDGVYYISWRYWAADAAQALGQENKWLKNAPWVLIGDAAAKICSDLGYDAGKTTALALTSSASDNLFRATINRNEAGKRRTLGGRL